MGNTLTMTQGKPLRLLVRFSLPLMFGNIFQQLYSVVDTAIVGQGVGMSALAALGSVDWLNWMMLGIACGFTQGFGVRIAQKYGENNQADLQKFMGQSALASIALALLCLGLGQLALPVFLQFLRVPDDLYAMAILYSRIIFGGIPVMFLYNYASAMLRAVGNSKTPLLAMAVASVTNIVLDLITVFVFRWGIAGAAGATVFAQCLSAVICVVKVYRTPQLRFSKELLRPRRDILKNLLKIGCPAAVKNWMIAIGGMAVMAVVNKFDTAFIAGFTASNKLYGLLEIAALSYGQAITTYVGQNYGAMRFDRIRSGIKSATVLSIATALVIAAAMFAFGRPITRLFISAEDPAQALLAGNVAFNYLRVMAAMMPALYMLYLFLSALQGLGDTVRPMISGFLELAMRLLVVTTVAVTGYASGIFCAEVAAWLGAAIYLGLHYRKFSRQTMH